MENTEFNLEKKLSFSYSTGQQCIYPILKSIFQGVQQLCCDKDRAH